MRHTCRCLPAREYTWTHSQLQAALEHHLDGVMPVGAKRFQLFSTRIHGTGKHRVRFRDIT